MADTSTWNSRVFRQAVSAATELSPLWRCRLCWKVTFAVFGLILGVESVMIVPSAWRFEDGEMTRLAERVQILVDPVLADARTRGTRPDLAAVIGREGLRGVAVRGPSGAVLASAGEVPATDLIPAGHGAAAIPISTEAGDRILVAVWRSAWIPDLLVTARIDAGDLPQRLHAYLLRIAGLIAVIVLVVTVGTMLVLDRWVLRPLMQLRQSAIAAGAAPYHAPSFTLREGRRDEMGELIHAHNVMLKRVADSRRRDQEMAAERASFLTHHDPLTGLPNRVALLELLERRRNSVQGATVLLVNVLRFRVLNATYGGAAADRLLYQLAQRFQRTAEPEDLLAHLGADRFVVVRSGIAAPHVTAALAERLLCAAEQPFQHAEGVEVSLSVRMGIAQSAADEGLSAQVLLSQAELALAHANESTDCKYQFYSPEIASAVRARQMLTQDLEQALPRHEFSVVFQPKVKLMSPNDRAQLSGAEVLLRWHHPTRGWVSPSEFIPIAESTGMMGPIGDFVLQAATERIRDWLTRFGWSPRLAINVSGQEFSGRDLVQQIKRALEITGIPADRLELEMTETTTMLDVERSIQVLTGLRELGVRVAIDDFGTGYSSLSYLRRFVVDAIKIDKSFVEGIGHDQNAETICDAILRLGQALRVCVVAEGVETEDQAAFLRRRNCEDAQGYLFGRPMPFDEFEHAWMVDQSDGAADRSNGIVA